MTMAYKYKRQAIASLVLLTVTCAALAAESTRRSSDDVVLLNGKQLFIDDYIIDEMQGVRKVLNRLVKHPKNPLVVPGLRWE